ncbi:MAG: MarR family transcriptional regulator [Alphaproteobacteria bacterium HGW-Alphaproteobacteria-6]|nr:MAG: MarR family transcriptional regulator [Alphaproteobacteria bacterium HGW-Alphaproteobacteria-6]
MTHSQALEAFSRIAAVLRSFAWQRAEAAGLSPTQAQILKRLSARGPSRISVLADDLGVTQPTISDAVAALLRKGHVARAPDPEDGRAVLLHLTQSGAQHAEAARVPAPAMLAALETLPAADRGAMQRGLVGLIRALQEARAIPVQRMCVTCAHFRPHAHDDAARPHHCAFVDAAFGDAALRIDCGDHEDAAREDLAPLWARFSKVA